MFSSSTATGLTVVLFAALLLALRNGLPRWISGTPSQAEPLWPLVLFLTYATLGLIVLVGIRWFDAALTKWGVADLLKRLLAGAIFILLLLAACIPLVFRIVVHLMLGKWPGTVNVVGLLALAGTLSVAIYVCWQLYRAAERQRRRVRQLQQEFESLEAALTSAELAMLEAQIEPHFLFNTLAHIKRQYRKQPEAADRMMTALIEYLEKALPALRHKNWTLGDELELIRVYLDILTVRFDERLHYKMTVPQECRQIRIPGMMIATLVENAVRHGLAPKAEGGTIQINVVADLEAVRIEVCDDGVGLRQSGGSGLGLATVRTRLRSEFGSEAQLKVEPIDPHGVRATCVIPKKSSHA